MQYCDAVGNTDRSLKLWKKVIKQRYKLTAFNIWPESFLSGNCYSFTDKSQLQHQTQIISRNLRFNRKVESSPVFFKWPAIRRNLRGLTPADTLMGISPGGEKALSTPGRKDQDDGAGMNPPPDGDVQRRLLPARRVPEYAHPGLWEIYQQVPDLRCLLPGPSQLVELLQT